MFQVSLIHPRRLLRQFKEWVKLHLRLLQMKTERKSLFVDVLNMPFYLVDTSRDPYHLNIGYFIEEANKLENSRILHLGAWHEDRRPLFKGYEKYIGFDIRAGEGVDIVGDCHHLSKYFPENISMLFSQSWFSSTLPCHGK